MSADSYRDLAEIPIYTEACFLKSSETSSVIQVTTSVSDHLRNVKRALQKTILVTKHDIIVTQAQDASDALASVVSPSGKLQAVLRQIRGEDNQKKRFVEIWETDRLIIQKDVTALHDDFYTDDIFSSLCFSPAESALIYTAEASEESKRPDASAKGSALYDKFRFRPHFGERFGGRKEPTIFLLRWDDVNAHLVRDHEYQTLVNVDVYALAPSLPADHVHVCFGQGTFATERLIFATGYEHTKDGRLLGPIYCSNRPAGIWSIHIPPISEPHSPLVGEQNDKTSLACSATRLTPDHLSCRSPRIVQSLGSSQTVAWLSTDAYGAHNSCSRLHSFDTTSSTVRVLVDTVFDPTSYEEFPGLYVDQLHRHASLSLGQKVSFIVVQSMWASADHILLISLESGAVHRLTPSSMDGVPYSWALLGTDGRQRILCSRSSLSCPNQLMMGYVSDKLPYSVQWTVVDSPLISKGVQSKLKTLSVDVYSLPNKKPVQTVVVRPVGTTLDRIMPLITFPHGGPHTASTTKFHAFTASLALQGYTISLPNYTGSLGFGEKYVKALLGTAGSLDVNDCMATIKHLIQLGIAKEGKGYQFVLGGSHGGFLGAHLIGQFPTFFSAASLLNPVIAAGEMSSTTDIPDWCYAEFDVPYGSKSFLDTATFAKLQCASPIAHVDAVQSPVLLLMGDKDQRVPPAQGRNYYHALKGRGKPVEMFWFPSVDHGLLDPVEVTRLAWEATKDWFLKFTS